MKKRWHAVAWDIDGTLIDSEPLHERALLAVCANYTVDIDKIDAERFRGCHMDAVWRVLKPGFPATLDYARWLADIEAYYIAHIERAVPYSDAGSTVRRLAMADIPQAFVSNSSRKLVDANLQRLGLKELRIPSISVDDVSNGKPDPAPYLAACRRLTVRPAQCIAVEDTPTGRRAAHSAGLYTVAITQGAVPPDMPMDHHIGRLGEVLDFFPGVL